MFSSSQLVICFTNSTVQFPVAWTGQRMYSCIYRPPLKVWLLSAPLTSHLLPGVQQHDILLVQVALCEVIHLGHPKPTDLIGAFKQPGTVRRLLPLQSETTQPFQLYNLTCLCVCLFVGRQTIFHPLQTTLGIF